MEASLAKSESLVRDMAPTLSGCHAAMWLSKCSAVEIYPERHFPKVATRVHRTRPAPITAVTSLSTWGRSLPMSAAKSAQSTTLAVWDGVTVQEIDVKYVCLSNRQLQPLAAMLTW
jgi:hypothetical protein